MKKAGYAVVVAAGCAAAVLTGLYAFRPGEKPEPPTAAAITRPREEAPSPPPRRLPDHQLAMLAPSSPGQIARLIAKDITAIKDRHPELAAWPPPDDQYCNYTHNLERVPGHGHKWRPTAPGARGCHIGLGFQGSMNRRAATEEFLYVNVGVRYEVEVGEDGDQEFAEEVRKVIRRRLEPLRKLDALARRCHDGIVADISAIKADHPELAEWKTLPPVWSWASYAHNYTDRADGRTKVEPEFGPHGCLIRLFPDTTFGMQRGPDYCFPHLGLQFYVDVKVAPDGDRAFADKIRGIIREHMKVFEGASISQGGKPLVPNPVRILPDTVGITGEYLLKNGFKKAPGVESYGRSMSVAELCRLLGVGIQAFEPVSCRPDGDPLHIACVGDWTCSVQPLVKRAPQRRPTGDLDLIEAATRVSVVISRR